MIAPMVSYAPSPMTSLVDVPARYDLAESTGPALRVRDLADPEALAGLALGYGTSQGDARLRALIAADTGVHADQVLVTTGAIEAMFLLAQDRCRPGDPVVLTTPCFPPARSVPAGLGADVVAVPLRFADAYRLDLDAVTAALRPRTRPVSVASPQNPSGVRFTGDELRALLAAVADRAPDAVVLVDETYREATYGDAPVHPSAAPLAPRVVTCASLSKAHGAPGLRLGWLTTTDPGLYERLRIAKFVSTIACSATDEYLAGRLLDRRREILAPRAARLHEAFGELEAWARDRPVDLVRPDAGAL